MIFPLINYVWQYVVVKVSWTNGNWIVGNPISRPHSPNLTTTQKFQFQDSLLLLNSTTFVLSLSPTTMMRISFFISLLLTISTVSANHGVFNVQYKFSDDQQRSLSVLKAHDYRRQISLLTGVDLPLGGTGRPDSVG